MAGTSAVALLESVRLRALDVSAVETPKSISTGTGTVVALAILRAIIGTTLLRTETLDRPGILAVALVLLGLGVRSTYTVSVAIWSSLTHRLLTGVSSREIRPSLSTYAGSVHASTM